MSTLNVAIYFSFVFLGMLYSFNKVGVTKISILIILVFWEGFFDYLNSILGLGIFNAYQIGIVAYSIYLLWDKKIHFFTNKSDKLVNIIFLLFTTSFWISYYFYGGEILTILSQYLYKFSFIWLAYHYFKDITYNIPKREYVKIVLIQVIFIQILIA